MNRRNFLKALLGSFLSGVYAPDIFASERRKISGAALYKNDMFIKDYLLKMKHFDEPHESDVVLDADNHILLKEVVSRLKRLEKLVGYANFNLMGIDEAILLAKSYARIGDFSRKETDFLEMIFYRKAEEYGFVDKKPLNGFTDKINKKAAVKISGTGHYLFNGEPLQTYNKIKKDIGNDVVLTSGIRSIVKQFRLFLSKAERSNGNLSLASRSLAPPGYSFHSVGDFDVGQINFGIANFTDRFTTTWVYNCLLSLGYAQFRYEQNNFLGVRFEPWHIKLVTG